MKILTVALYIQKSVHCNSIFTQNTELASSHITLTGVAANILHYL